MHGLRDVPLVGRYMKVCGGIFVDRDSRKSRSDAVHEIKKRVQTEQPIPQIMIFPEGTITNAQCLVQFKVGAFIPGIGKVR